MQVTLERSLTVRQLVQCTLSGLAGLDVSIMYMKLHCVILFAYIYDQLHVCLVKSTYIYM